MRLLLTEDDEDLAAALVDELGACGYTVDRAASLDDGRIALATSHYGALVLDRGLPDGDGLDLVRQLRRQGNPLPVVVLTARGELEARVQGLEAGADDYLAKPFAPEELVARLRAVLRRSGQFQGREITLANLMFDTDHGQLRVDGRLVTLSQRESEVLALLIRRVGLVVTRRLAEDQIYGMQELLGSNAIEVYVHRLRQKLEAAGARAEILTVRGVGYILRASEG